MGAVGQIVRILGAGLLGGVLGAFACAEYREIDFPDVNIPPPGPAQLEAWQKNFEEGRIWRANPRRVAHEELRVRLDVPWKGESFDPSRYEFIERNPQHPDWGSYVVRGYADDGGRRFRYRVKVARHGDIWYARQISRFAVAEMVDEPRDAGPPVTR